jgi:uncharacterized membrane protein YbaN (DUF454 family)
MGAAYRGIGLSFVLLATVGAFVPLLPTTPFLLLASACFMRSSPKWNERLLQSPLFGQLLRDWHAHRYVRTTNKRIAMVSMFLLGSFAVIGSGHSSTTIFVLILPMPLVAVLIMILPSEPRVLGAGNSSGRPVSAGDRS